jgi:hypothetical protein
VLAPVLVDERRRYRGGRSSCAWAKYADAFFKIPLARRSYLTSCSSSLIRRVSSVLVLHQATVDVGLARMFR